VDVNIVLFHKKKMLFSYGLLGYSWITGTLNSYRVLSG